MTQVISPDSELLYWISRGVLANDYENNVSLFTNQAAPYEECPKCYIT